MMLLGTHRMNRSSAKRTAALVRKRRAAGRARIGTIIPKLSRSSRSSPKLCGNRGQRRDLLAFAPVRLEHDVGVRDPQRRVFAKPAERALRRCPQESRPLIEDLGGTCPLLPAKLLEQRFAPGRWRPDCRNRAPAPWDRRWLAL